MTALFIVLGAVVVVATGLALAGRWRPEGLDPGPPSPELPLDHGQPRFDVVLRGYRMDQVDAELARLRGLLRDQPAPVERSDTPDGQAGMRPNGGDPTIEP